jgi:hypothetical protein
VKHLLPLVVAIAMLVSASAQTPQPSAPAQPGGNNDVYHVHFTKAALGQAGALGQSLSKPDSTSPMPEHFIVLRHQQGDDWDYVVIQHLGPKATVEVTPAPPAATRDLSAWHGDTFAAGPSWAEFSKAMGLGDQAKNTAGSAYSVAVWRAAPGHRDQLEQQLKQTDPNQKVKTGRVLLQHLEGGPWNYLAIERYDSWQDFATDQAASSGAIGSGQDGWSKIREHAAFHRDTLADRIAPK